MPVQVSEGILRIWKIQEFAGILPNKKLSKLIEHLDEKFSSSRLESDERLILAAYKLHGLDRKARREFLRRELLAWEKRVNAVY